MYVMSSVPKGKPELRKDRLPLWTLRRSASPIVGTAIHDGHLIERDTIPLLAVAEDVRLREEDPFTGELIAGLPTQLIFHRSRFSVDLNRSREKCIYMKPSDAWNIKVWKKAPSAELAEGSRQIHDRYYEALASTLDGVKSCYGAFVVLDIHSYNHRRAGPNSPPSDADAAPDINIGTASMDRSRWAPVVERFMEFCRSREIMGQRLDVRENVAFQGHGEQTRYIHERYPNAGCAIAVEFKKIFMDEWTGEPNRLWLHELRTLLSDSVPVLEHALTSAKP